jgi:hypothetical protein
MDDAPDGGILATSETEGQKIQFAPRGRSLFLAQKKNLCGENFSFYTYPADFSSLHGRTFMKRMVMGAVVAAGLLGFATLLPAQDGDGETRTLQQAPDTVWIEIVAVGEDSIAARPNSVSVLQGQAVGWRSELGNWRVFFRSPQPFGPGATDQGLGGNRGQKQAWTVRPQATPQSYKYDIMVVIPGQGPIRVDPEIVVRRPGGR